MKLLALKALVDFAIDSGAGDREVVIPVHRAGGPRPVTPCVNIEYLGLGFDQDGNKVFLCATQQLQVVTATPRPATLPYLPYLPDCVLEPET